MEDETKVVDAEGARAEGVIFGPLEEHLGLFIRDMLVIRGAQDVAVRTCKSGGTATAVGIGRERSGDVVLVAQAGMDAVPLAWGGRGRFLRRDMDMHVDRLRCLRSERGEHLSFHGIVEASRVRVTVLRDNELSLMRWVLS